MDRQKSLGMSSTEITLSHKKQFWVSIHNV